LYQFVYIFTGKATGSGVWWGEA